MVKRTVPPARRRRPSQAGARIRVAELKDYKVECHGHRDGIMFTDRATVSASQSRPPLKS